jgi:hypothetical protein
MTAPPVPEHVTECSSSKGKVLKFAPCLKSVLVKAVLKARVMPARPEGDKLPKTPKDYGMEYKDIDFQSSDGIKIAAWLIPGKQKKLAIMNHPLTCTRYGALNGECRKNYIP